MCSIQRIQEELSEIRIALYEETKHLTIKQRVEQRRARVRAFIKECGYNIIESEDGRSYRITKRATEQLHA